MALTLSSTAVAASFAPNQSGAARTRAGSVTHGGGVGRKAKASGAGVVRRAQRALGRLDPFELKEHLVSLAEEHARHGAHLLLNAGRGNPNWVASTYFGATGRRLGEVAPHEVNVIDRRVARHPAREHRAIEQRYVSLVLDPGQLKFIDRLVADSRQIALNHTAGLLTPQQVQMVLLALSALLDPGERYKRLLRDVLRRRLAALYLGLGAPLPPDPVRAGYYAELDLMVWAERHYGADFAHYLQHHQEPVDLLLRLAEQASIVLMPGAGFSGPAWSVRVSLANMPEVAYARIRSAHHTAARDYVRQWRAAREHRLAKRRRP